MKEQLKTLGRPIAVLAVICLVVTAALAAGYQVTDPIIKEAQARAAQAARAEVLPQGDSFTALSTDGMPQRVSEVYKADNGAGYVMSLTTKGYGGKMKLMVGIAADGTIAGVKALDVSNETTGVGSKVAGAEFASQFPGKGPGLEGVDTISGATVSSGSYIAAVRDAFTAFEQLTGKEGA